MANKIKNSNIDADIVSGATLLDEGAATGDFLLVYDSSAGALRRISQTNLLNFPTISSVSPTNLTSGDGTGNHTVVITGSGFTGATASLLNNSGSTVSFASQTVDSATQITGVIAKSSLPGSGEPYDVKVLAGSGLVSTLANQINIDQQPVFSTAAGSLGSVADGGRSGLSFTVAAADPESGGDVVYTLESGSIPAGLSFSSTSSGAVISGNASAVGSNTTSTFTIRAKDVASNVSDRQFTIQVLAPAYQSFTSSGTFSVPSGLTAVDVLVVAGGGGGGSEHGSTGVGGGGAGGLIYRPAFPVTPGGTITVTVGNGGAGIASSTSGNGTSGQDSVFGTLTAKGGGGGGGVSPFAALSGGSGGGGAGPSGNGGSATQPNQSSESGNYGFGSAGGQGGTPGGGNFGGGGGGGGAAQGGGQGGPAPVHGDGGNGGNGKAYTIADGSTPVYYAGGGGGSSAAHSSSQGSGGQGGGTPGSKTGDTTPGTANRGGGAGATRQANASGSGGKGIVIVQY